MASISEIASTNPAKILQNVLDDISNKVSDPSKEIIDSTNPVLYSLEFAASAAASATQEYLQSIKTIFASLANTRAELLEHATDLELEDLFAVPASNSFTILVNVLSLRNFGYRPINSDYIEMILPKYSEVSILNTIFTTTNDVIVRIYDDGRTYVEQVMNNELAIAANDIGVIPSDVIEDAESAKWIRFILPIKQIMRFTLSTTIIDGANFISEVKTSDFYYYATVAYSNQYTGNKYEYLPVQFDKTYLDKNKPTALYVIGNDGIFIRIPDIYLINNSISGNVEIAVYTTKGAIDLPADAYDASYYSYNIKDDSTSISASKSKNITMLFMSAQAISGGKNFPTNEELRDLIIYNSTGPIDTPVNKHNIVEFGLKWGYQVRLALDVVTERIFTATRAFTLPSETELIRAKPNILNALAQFVVTDLTNVETAKAYGDVLIIKSKTIFYSENGILKIVKDDERNLLRNSSVEQLITLTKNKKYFYNPFYYVIDKKEDVTECRIYDMDNPKVDSVSLLSKNNSLDVNVNTYKYGIEWTTTGYKLTITLNGNIEYNNLDKGSLSAQLRFRISDSDGYVSIEGRQISITINDAPVVGFTFDIKTDMYINTDGKLLLNNGYSSVVDKYIDLTTSGNLYIYNPNSLVLDQTKFLTSELQGITVDNDTVVYTKESINIIFGCELKYLWNRMYTTYTDRKYKKYSVNVPKVYSEDVYTIDPDTGSKFKLEKQNGIVKLTSNIIHSKGDIVLDVNGDIVYEHLAGDNMLDSNGEPILDIDSGICRNVYMTLLELVFLFANTTAHRNYLDRINSSLREWIISDLTKMNKSTLEATTLKFIGNRKIDNTKTTINGVPKLIPFGIVPKVTLYTTQNIDSDRFESIKDRIGKIIHDSLESIAIRADTISNLIIDAIGKDIVASVKIIGLDGNNGDIKAFNISDESNRPTLDIYLDRNVSNELIVRYRIDLEIINIT